MTKRHQLERLTDRLMEFDRNLDDIAMPAEDLIREAGAIIRESERIRNGGNLTVSEDTWADDLAADATMWIQHLEDEARDSLEAEAMAEAVVIDLASAFLPAGILADHFHGGDPCYIDEDDCSRVEA